MTPQEKSSKAVDPHPGTRQLFLVYLILMVLLGFTVLAAYLPLGWFNLALAVVIAAAKVSLVVWYFMHLRQTRKLAAVFFLAGFFTLAVSGILTFADYLTRS